MRKSRRFSDLETNYPTNLMQVLAPKQIHTRHSLALTNLMRHIKENQVTLDKCI